MRLRADQLQKELGNQLRPVYLISGDEPLLVQEAMNLIRSACKVAQFEERKVFHVDRQFDWSSLNDEANSLSLFAEKKLIELRLGKAKPGPAGAKALLKYLEQPSSDNILLIECAKLDSSATKSKWLKSIEQAGSFVQIWPIGLEEMPKWVAQRAQKMGLNINREAISLLSGRLEGNLLAAVQELEKLKLNYQASSITEAEILASVEDSSRYNIFNLTDACVTGDSIQAIRILNHLRTEGVEPTIALWALTKEVRLISALRHTQNSGRPANTIFSKQFVIKKRQPSLLSAANRLSQSNLQAMLALCAECDQQIKGFQRNISPWETLLDVAAALSGAPINNLFERAK